MKHMITHELLRDFICFYQQTLLFQIISIQTNFFFQNRQLEI